MASNRVQEKTECTDKRVKAMHTSFHNSESPTLGQGVFLVVFIPVVFVVMLGVFALCFVLSLFNRSKTAFA